MSDNTVTIPLTQGQETIIDAVDADLLKHKWQSVKSKSGYYAYRKTGNDKGKYNIRLHQVILERILDRPLEKGEKTDHVNGNSLDNRRENLRLATHAQNMQNSKKQSNNESGYKGVSWHKRDRVWRAKIMAYGKEYFLGQFDTPEKAYQVYCEAAIRLHGEFARFE